MRLTCHQIIEELTDIKTNFEKEHCDERVSDAYQDAIEAVRWAFMKEAWYHIQCKWKREVKNE